MGNVTVKDELQVINGVGQLWLKLSRAIWAHAPVWLESPFCRYVLDPRKLPSSGIQAALQCIIAWDLLKFCCDRLEPSRHGAVDNAFIEYAALRLELSAW